MIWKDGVWRPSGVCDVCDEVGVRGALWPVVVSNPRGDGVLCAQADLIVSSPGLFTSVPLGVTACSELRGLSAS